MFSKKKTFVEMCLNGDVDLEEIDRFVEKWHVSSSSIPIYEYLGLTEKEYSVWIEKPSSLPYILNAHKINQPIDYVLECQKEFSLAARSLDSSETKKIYAWLIKNWKTGL